MMHPVRRRYLRRNPREAVGLIWFSLIAMPLLMISLALAVDFARLVMVGHSMRNVADAAAAAGAWQIQPGTVVLDEPAAAAAANETACLYTAHVSGVEAAPNHALVSCEHPLSTEITFANDNVDTETEPGTGHRTITVSLHYKVPGLIFPAVFGGPRSVDDAVAVKSADVCVPGDVTNYAGGFCDRAISDH